MKEKNLTTNSYGDLPNVKKTNDGIKIRSTSTGSSTLEAKYFYSLPKSIDIFKNINNHINIIKNLDIRDFLLEFSFRFQKALLFIQNTKHISNYLPPLMINQLEDESVLIEWVFKDFRIGFAIEPKLSESSWYLIANKNLDELSVSGALKLSDIDLLFNKIILYVIRNS